MKGNRRSRSERQRALGNGSIGMQREAESGPTMWERLLAGLSLSEDDAIAILGRKRQGPRAKLLEWIRRFRNGHYVPEPVLAAAGLMTHWDDEAVFVSTGRRTPSKPQGVRVTGVTARMMAGGV